MITTMLPPPPETPSEPPAMPALEEYADTWRALHETRIETVRPGRYSSGAPARFP